MLGGAFTPQEDLPHGGKVVVLSYGLRQRRFGGDAAIVGKSLSLGNEPYTIVGVVGKDFVFDAVLTLAFGIGPTTATFSILEGVLLRPLPFADPATLEALGDVADGADPNGAPNVSASQVVTLFP